LTILPPSLIIETILVAKVIFLDKPYKSSLEIKVTGFYHKIGAGRKPMLSAVKRKSWIYGAGSVNEVGQ
jgi:hypothetical protein